MKLLIANEFGHAIFEGTIPPGKDGLVIGSDKRCQVCLPYLSVAARHVRVQRGPDAETILQDLEGVTPVTVNGQPLPPGFVARIAPGDRVQLTEELNLTVSVEPGDQLPPDPELPEPSVFPFFIDRNQRYINEAFETLRSKISSSTPGTLAAIEATEELVQGKIGELSAIMEVSFALNSIHNYHRLLEYVLDMALKVTHSERGAILLFNEESERLETVFMRGGSQRDLERDLKSVATEILKCFRTGEMVFDPPLLAKKESGRQRRTTTSDTGQKAVAIAPLRNQSGTIGVLYLDRAAGKGAWTGLVQDILRGFSAQASTAIQSARHLHLATTDGLTGLSNQKHFHQRLLEEFYRAVRHRQPLSVLLLDLDHFQEVNEKFGTSIGDQVLKKVARYLRLGMRVHDLAARYSGEEFAILLPSTPPEGALIVAQKMLDRLGQPMYKSGKRSVKISATIGISTVSPRTTRPMDLLRAADEGMRQAKTTGKPIVTLIA